MTTSAEWTPSDSTSTGGFHRTSGARLVSQKGEARSSLHLICAAPNPLILFVPFSLQKA